MAKFSVFNALQRDEESKKEPKHNAVENGAANASNTSGAFFGNIVSTENAARREPLPFDRTRFERSQPPSFLRDLPAVENSNTADSAIDIRSAPAFQNRLTEQSDSANLPNTARSANRFDVREIDADRVEPHLVAVREPRSPFTEEYRTLRANLLNTAQKQKLQAMVVASANPNEGKSLTALNLAWLLAQTDGVRAILIDSDLRMPCLTDYLAINVPHGLSEVLAGEADLFDSIVRLEPSGLHLLSGGKARDNVAELLSGPRFRAVLEELRKQFDFIVIDAPPLGIFADASVLINRTDGAILVVRAGQTKYADLARLTENLPKERMLGVVLNGGEFHLKETYHNYYNNQ